MTEEDDTAGGWGNEEVYDNQGPTATMMDLPEVKLFGKWSLNDVEVTDISLVVPHQYFFIFFK